jgi:formylglycine-generating enzyme required for sulfatase activity
MPMQLNHLSRSASMVCAAVVVSWLGAAVCGQVAPATQSATEATAAQSVSAPAELRMELGDGITMEFVRIPEGKFVMGSPADESGRRDDEGQHEVQVSGLLYMARTETSQAQYAQVMKSNPSVQKGDAHPVDSVRWTDAVEFCRRLSEQTGRLVRLPTEAEWEYAARAGSRTPFAGTGKLDDMGWYALNSGDRSHPVAGKRPNEWGLFDMHGNVAEWCADEFKVDTPDVHPPLPSTSPDHRVIRGGSWDKPATQARSAARSGGAIGERYDLVGFRCVVEVRVATDPPSTRPDR